MFRPSLRALAAIAAAFAALVLAATPALAHEKRTVGAYTLAVGWSNEPTYAGAQNGVQVFIHDAAGQPVADLGDPSSLKVQVIYGTQKSPTLELVAAYGSPGEFDAVLTPTEVGTYTFHLTGSINGQPVDERFTSSDTTFDDVDNPTSIEFPTKTPTNQELAAAQTRTQTRVVATEGTARTAKDSSSTSATLAIIALVLAVVLGGSALLVALRHRAASPTPDA